MNLPINNAHTVYTSMLIDENIISINKSDGFNKSRVVIISNNKGEMVAQCPISELITEIQKEKINIKTEDAAKTLAKGLTKLKEAEIKQLEEAPSWHNRIFGGHNKNLDETTKEIDNSADKMWWSNNILVKRDQGISATEEITQNVNLLDKDNFIKFITHQNFFKLPESYRSHILRNLGVDQKEWLKKHIDTLYPKDYPLIINILGILSEEKIDGFISDALIKKIIKNPNPFFQNWSNHTKEIFRHYSSHLRRNTFHRVSCAVIARAANVIQENNLINFQKIITSWAEYDPESLLVEIRDTLVVKHNIIDSDKFDEWVPR